jgi:hypothetical protein
MLYGTLKLRANKRNTESVWAHLLVNMIQLLSYFFIGDLFSSCLDILYVFLRGTVY